MDKSFPNMLLDFTLDGSSLGQGDRNVTQESWRRLLRDETKVQLSKLGKKHNKNARIKIVCRFFVKKSPRGYDLDNMVKYLIDGLGAGGLFKRAKSGHRSQWNTDDSVVYSICAGKEEDDKNPRTEVEVWTE
jgi:Holliday junction resolvase RusA-like endonuclease